MKDEKKQNLHEELLRKFKYRVDYKVNESPRYREVIQTEEFDEPPKIKEAGEQEDAMKPEGGGQPPAPTNDQPIDAPVPAFDKTGGDPMAGGAPVDPNASVDPNAPVDPNADPTISSDPMGMGDPASAGMPNPAQQVDTLQNDIIKHNIEAMKSIHDKLESLDMAVQQLNAQSKSLSAEVEEVREPTNTEKLMSKKNVSYPYYFNLNDFWSGNWFNEQREKEHEKGINQLPDGSFVADFDDLPQKSKPDVQKSFNEIT